MVGIQIICVGKLKEKFYAQAAAEYAKRLGGFCKLTIWELPETKLPRNPTQGQIDGALERERAAIMEKLPKDGKLTALCIEGDLSSSQDLAARLHHWTVNGVSQLSFLIGGSFGLAPSVKRRADWRLSMSPMTFPHHLARVMLLEQLYRAFQINAGSPYHK